MPATPDSTVHVTSYPRQTKRALQGHRLFAFAWDWLVRREGKASREMRAKLLGAVRGRVLEIGCGTGANFPYYSPDAQVVATEPDPYMLRRAERRLAQLGLANVESRQAPGEDLPFDDGSFDHVVCSWVLCHVGDAPGALAEVRRLLKPDGSFRFMEHVRSESRVWSRAQDIVDPVWSRLLDAGCHVNRRTQHAIEEAGFRMEWVERAHLSPPTTPGIYGVARPR